MARFPAFTNIIMSFVGLYFFRLSVRLLLSAALFLFSHFTLNTFAQESANTTGLKYPLALIAKGSDVFIVDLELPGILRFDGKEVSTFHIGSGRIRGELNRPRCVAFHPKGGLLVGDSATNEIYHVKGEGLSATAITDGLAGIPMCLALDPSGETIFFGDAESRSILKVSTMGGTPELLSKFNARALCFDDQSRLWALGTDKVCMVSLSTGKLLPVLESPPFAYPNSMFFWKGAMLVTDGYKSAIWRVDANGACRVWFEGTPIRSPVGIVGSDEYGVLVADPKSRSVFAIVDAKSTGSFRVNVFVGKR